MKMCTSERFGVQKCIGIVEPLEASAIFRSLNERLDFVFAVFAASQLDN